MVAIRSAVYLLFLAMSVVAFSVPLSLLGLFAPQHVLGRIGSTWARLNLWALRSICGLSYRLEGFENFPKDACVVLCKHQSAWETIALRALLPPIQQWVLKRELLWVPFFGWALAAYRPIAIDRKAGRKAVRQVIDQGVRGLASGRCVVIFPEGTRVAPGERKRYGIGGALLAERSGAPVIPVAHNAGVFWRRRGLHKYPGTIDLVFGEAFSSEGMTANEINRKVEDWIERTVASLPNTR